MHAKKYGKAGRVPTSMNQEVGQSVTPAQYCQSNLGGCLVSLGNWTNNRVGIV